MEGGVGEGFCEQPQEEAPAIDDGVDRPWHEAQGRGTRTPLEEAPKKLDGATAERDEQNAAGPRTISADPLRGIEQRLDRSRLSSTVLFEAQFSDHKDGLDNDGY